MTLNIREITNQYNFSEKEKEIINNAATGNTAEINQSRIISALILGKKIESSIDQLAQTINNASASSNKLAESITIATWVAGVASIFGIVLGSISLYAEFQSEDFGIREKVFNECFNYYANINPQKGVDATLIELCKEKAMSWK